MARLDPHSYFDSSQPRAERLDWTARVDFATRTLHAEASLSFASPALDAGPLDLDTRGLLIDAVTDESAAPLPFTLAPEEPILGARLRIELPADARGVTIRYRTSETASALQWLTPAQTAGGRHPFLFSQCQAIHARSVVPLQDSPELRIRYHAALEVPRELRALMAAGFVRRVESEGIATEYFEMPQSIPPYLFALAVGDSASRELGPRSRVWAEPSVVEAAAHEFAGVDAMLVAAEQLFGPYDWQRFDILTMPPSFPYGGMENPRLTFLTPTLLAGDQSLVNVVAHELAHSWTGNLVSNANAEHFWLNEGFTVYAERRIIELLEGPEVTALHAALGRRELLRAIERFAKQPELTRLRTHLEGVDPDEAFSSIPYEKGYLFLRTLEEAAGREAFSRLLRAYLRHFRFLSITSDDFIGFVRREQPGLLEKVDVRAWLDGAGLPEGAPVAHSKRIDAIAALDGKLPSEAMGRGFTPAEWQLYLESLQTPVPHDRLDTLEARFRLGESRNYEVLVAWLVVAAESDYAATRGRTEEVLGRVGRMKYLRPLYNALLRHPSSRKDALRCFEKYKEGYHPIARQVVEGLIRASAEGPR